MNAETRRWRPAPLLWLSALIHLGALALLCARWSTWPWVVGGLLANHLLLTMLGMLPRSGLLGSNWTRLPAAHREGRIAITIDDGPDPHVTPEALRILAAYGVRATFFCVGRQARRYPTLVRACVAAGHAVENHTDRHPRYFALLGFRALRREIVGAQRSLAELSGAPPRFFRAPAGVRSPLLDLVLQRAGLQLAAWTRRGFDTISADAERVFVRLTSQLRAGDILLLHDGHTARDSQGRPVLLQVLPRLLELLRARGLTAVTLRELLP